MVDRDGVENRKHVIEVNLLKNSLNRIREIKYLSYNIVAIVSIAFSTGFEKHQKIICEGNILLNQASKLNI